MCDLTCLAHFTVAEGEGTAILDGDRVKLAGGRDAVAVEAEGHAIDGYPSVADRHIFGQIVVARRGDAGQVSLRADCRPVVMVRMTGQVLIRRQRDLFVRPLQNGDHLLRTGEGGLLFLRQGVVGLIGLGRGKAGALPRRIVHAVQFRRVRQSVDHRLHGGHGLLRGRVLLLFFLFRRLALPLRGRRLILLLRFPVCRVCRFLHGRGRLCRPLRLLCQRRRGKQRQAQGQRHETAQDTLLHRFPPVRFLLCPNQSPTDRDLPVGRTPYGSGGAPGQFFSFRCSV